MDATDLCFAGAAEQARLVAAGEVSARELVEAALDCLRARARAAEEALAAGINAIFDHAGRPRDEATLLSLAAQIEQVRPTADRRPPR